MGRHHWRGPVTNAVAGAVNVHDEEIVKRLKGRSCGATAARNVLAALRAEGYAVIKLPTVAYKGPHDTDAKFFRQVADRLEMGRRTGEVGGSNVRAAVSELLRNAAAEAEK